MEMENKKFKKISSSVVPCAADFVEAIRREYRIPDCQLIPGRACNIWDDHIDQREFYATKVMSARRRFLDKLFKVLDEFPGMSQINPLYASLLLQRNILKHYHRALIGVSHATNMIDEISEHYVELLKKDDCDSRSLTMTALACMFTLAKRCIPALAYLNEVREYMANLEDAAAITLKNDFLPPQDYYPFPRCVFGDEIAKFVDPETLLWLKDLDRLYQLWLKGDDHQEEDCDILCLKGGEQ